LHSLHFYQDLMREARARIRAGDFDAWSADLIRRWAAPGGAANS
jgi:queuine/archaeosine tRNA-ribosyltransferase